MKIPLQAWYDAWLAEHAKTNLIYARGPQGGPSLAQVHYVRDTLASIFWTGVPAKAREREPEPRTDRPVTAWVVGEHRSKSVRLPVFLLERDDLRIKFVLRNNFYDWNVSVISERPITSDLRGFELDFRDGDERVRWEPGRSWSYLFFQGFPPELCFGPHSLDNRRFSLPVYSNEEVYMLVALIMRDLRS